MELSFEEFATSTIGRPFQTGSAARDLLAFLSDDDRQRRLEEAEIHHDRPPLAGVIMELEAHPNFQKMMSTTGFEKALGAVVTFVMVKLGWRPARYATPDRERSYQRARSPLGVSKQLKKAARFAPQGDHPGFPLWKAAHPSWESRPLPGTATRMGTGGRTAAQETVEIMDSLGLSVSRFAMALKVSETAVRHWIAQASRDGGAAADGRRATTPTQGHLKRARGLTRNEDANPST